MTDVARGSEQVDGVRLPGGRPPGEPVLVTDINPADGVPLAVVAGGAEHAARAAVDVAADALPAWSGTLRGARASALRAIAAAIRADAELPVLVSRETGKRLAESRAESGLAAAFFEHYAELIAGPEQISGRWVPHTVHHVRQRPLGVVGVSTPWNFPVSIPARKVAPALAAGCTVVCKPSEVAPLSGLRFAEILDAHLPPGVVTTIVGDPVAISAAWLSDPRVRGFSFTGSTEVGRALAARASAQLTHLVLELGGNAPFVLLPDLADEPPALTAAVECLLTAKYRNNGQSCIAANQAWVPRALVDEVVELFCAGSAGLELGDPLDAATGLGPMALPTDAGRLDELAEDARAHGAAVLRPHAGPLPSVGQYAEPIVLVDPGPGARCRRTEAFGPLLVVHGYDDVTEVVDDVAADPAGLGGFVCGRDVPAARAFAARLDVGIVGVNTAAPNTPAVPFAGVGVSGVGVEGGPAGLAEFLAPQTIAVAGE